jgi:hypothetical protein
MNCLLAPALLDRPAESHVQLQSYATLAKAALLQA